MKSFLPVLFSGVLFSGVLFVGETAAAQSVVQITRAVALHSLGECLIQRGKEQRGAPGRSSVNQAVAAFEGALRIVNVTSPEPGRWAWVASRVGTDQGRRLLEDPAFAPGAPTYPAFTLCNAPGAV